MKNIKKVIASVLFLNFSMALSGCSSFKPPTGPAAEAPTDSAAVAYPPAPLAIMDREMTMVDGSKMKLADKRGKVLLVNLWATWCAPCIEEMPDLVKMHEELGPQGFEVIGINTETTEGSIIEELDARIKAFIGEHSLSYANGYMPEGMFDEFAKLSKLAGIPQSIIVDREGKLRGVFAGGGKKNVDKMWETSRKVVAGN